MSLEDLSLDQVKLYIASSHKYVTNNMIKRLPDQGRKIFEYRDKLYKIFFKKAREERKNYNRRKVNFFKKVVRYEYETTSHDGEEEKTYTCSMKKKRNNQKIGCQIIKLKNYSI